MPAKSKASGTIPATSSVFSRRSSTSHCGGPTWATSSRPILPLSICKSRRRSDRSGDVVFTAEHAEHAESCSVFFFSAVSAVSAVNGFFQALKACAHYYSLEGVDAVDELDGVELPVEELLSEVTL